MGKIKATLWYNIRIMSMRFLSKSSLRLQKNGFTILELILYIGIATIVLLAISAMLLNFVDSWGRGRARARVEENLRFAIQAIQESASSADEILEPSSGSSDTLRLALSADSDNQTFYGWAWSGNEDSDGTIPTVGQPGTWTTTTQLPLVRSRHSAVLLDSYIYAMGGLGADDSEGSAQSAIYFAQPNASTGQVASWTLTQSLPAQRSRGGATVLNGYIYFIGGTDSSGNSTATVFFSKQTSDGTGNLEPWSSTTSLPSNRGRLATVAANGYLYVLGGSNSSAVYYAKPNADGTIPASGSGAWTATTSLPQARQRHAATVVGNYVYVLGGTNSSEVVQNTVYYAQLNSDGTVGAWSATSTLLIALSRLGVATYAGYMYTTGGRDSSNVERNVVYSAKVNQDGTLGSWRSLATLPLARARHASVIANGYLYVLAGRASGTTYNTVYVSKLNVTYDIGWISFNCREEDGVQEKAAPFDCVQSWELLPLPGPPFPATQQFDLYAVKRTAGTLSGYAVNCPANASDQNPCLPISFNCNDALNYDTNACGISDYRVTVDGNGIYRGWAWGGEVIGWISFNCENTDSCFTASPPGTNPCGSDAGDWKVCETKVTTSGTEGAELHGWAWSENIGWISLNCADREVCTTSDYKVISKAEGTIRNFSVDGTGRIMRQDGTQSPVPLTAANVRFEKCDGWANYFEHFANPPSVRSGARICLKASYSGIGANRFGYSSEQQLSVALQ
ncbi:MAG: hypothetical protein A2806_00510 [Candidatus Terrybacteria bacterium RIFCSPHIGHO2_01_FULL_48_17]|uniref:Uncharacterized protein n=1 Tax=Candidatus Terrybacteria bacterium RIFCSPHIGHO2_01_FULL_48_17 TaxID=1802362 RepID=A0A1G2PII0_9BACT|nr:MAG: hypothetical protein A2806_00510 [Candidatus Terrybacteria bacterium RIFCSPHIGHO2_01_FULL_48_17]